MQLSRETLLPRLAAHVLEHGLGGASLRPLARAAGTSDRMLIYHFGCKEDLVSALLAHLGDAFRRVLDETLPPGRFACEREGVVAILALMRAEQAAGFQRVWFDILGASARGSMVHRATGREIMRSLHDWLTARMPEGTAGAPARAADLLIRIEGILVAAEVGLDDLAEAAISRVCVQETDDGQI